MPVDPSPTGSDFSLGLNFPHSILVFLVLKQADPYGHYIPRRDHILTEVQEEDLQEIYSI